MTEFDEKLSALAKEKTALETQRLRALAALGEKEERDRLFKLTCFGCRTVNPEGAKFCEECGAKLGEPPREVYRACGTMNQPGITASSI